ncbi:MAG: prolipoprotein diacylglyceryl transferase [Planctomycetes bacterium]|nr:prolipoprotein diacylglyceryl transferase [Planctomycetota bacterium]
MITILEIAFPNLDPTILPIYRPFALRWYGLGYLFAFFVGWLVLRHTQKKGFFRIAEEDCSSLLMYVIIGVFAGGRLGYILFYDDPIQVLRDPSLIFGRDFSGISGLSFHGGLLGVMIAGVLFAWVRGRRQYRTLPLEQRKSEGLGGIGKRARAVWCDGFDAMVLGVPAGIVFVRIANFVNGELYGREITDAAGNPVTDAALAPDWAMRFPTSDEGRAALNDFYQMQQFTNPEAPPVDFHKVLSLPVDQNVWDQVSQNVTLRHPSQIYQALLEGLAVLIVMWLLRKRFPKKGMLGGCFLIAYAAARFPMEYFRQPDVQFEAGEKLGSWGQTLASMGVTQGQLLCIGMAAIGVIMFTLCARSKNPFMARTAEQRAFRAVPMSAEEAGVPEGQRNKKKAQSVTQP